MIDPAIAAHGPDVRSFTVESVVNAPPHDVWTAWTAADQIATWWGPPDTKIDFRVGGAFEILFNMDEPYGRQGSEGCVYLGYIPDELISFTWNAPPHLTLREAHTWVVLRFSPVEDGTLVRLTHTGFLTGDDWDAYIDYFRSAWVYVLSLLSKHWD